MCFLRGHGNMHKRQSQSPTELLFLLCCLLLPASWTTLHVLSTEGIDITGETMEAARETESKNAAEAKIAATAASTARHHQHRLSQY